MHFIFLRYNFALFVGQLSKICILNFPINFSPTRLKHKILLRWLFLIFRSRSYLASGKGHRSPFPNKTTFRFCSSSLINSLFHQILLFLYEYEREYSVSVIHRLSWNVFYRCFFFYENFFYHFSSTKEVLHVYYRLSILYFF